MIKAVIFIKRRKDLIREQFKGYWLTKHVKLEQENVEKNWARRIVASFVLGGVEGAEPPFNGMVDLYFDSIEDMKKDVMGPQREIMYADEENFCDHSEPQIVAVTQEYLMAVTTPRESARSEGRRGAEAAGERRGDHD